MWIRLIVTIIGLLLAVLMAGGASLMSGSQLSRSVNLLLPNDWTIQTPTGISAAWQSARLPQLELYYQNCPLVKMENLQVQWQTQPRLTIENLTIDLHCSAQISATSADETPTSLPALLALLPEGELEISAIHWRNIPQTLSPRLINLLESPTYSRFAFFRGKLTAFLHQNAHIFSATLLSDQLIATIDYQPTAEKHQFELEATLSPQLNQLPTALQLHYHWQLSDDLIADEALQQGAIHLNWQQLNQRLSGELSLHSTLAPENSFRLPFHFDGEQLSIEQGQFHWHALSDFPLRGFVHAQFRPNALSWHALYPVDTSFRLSLQSQNAKGKGNVVISTQTGELQKNGLNLPLQITGDIKYSDFILYSTIPLRLFGEWNDLHAQFQPGSLLRLTGKARLLTVNELRFPLAGVRVNKQGIHGRLQAIFKGESPDFKQIELHLDGFAQDFKAGHLGIFSAMDTKGADLWQWRFWGKSQPHNISAPLTLSGRGKWHDSDIQLTEFHGEIGKIQQQGVLIPRTQLRLTKPISFAYRQWALEGEMALSASNIRFDYGGELEKPTAQLQLQGQIENLNLKGKLSAGQLGPITFFARRELTTERSRFVGRIYWQEQPANVFQSLFPFRQHWLITGGTIRGETAFSANIDDGFIAGGHFAIRNGQISLPKGEIHGISFSLPYQFRGGEFHLGHKQPLEVRINTLDLGVQLQNLRVKIHGHFPYSRKKPLYLQHLSLNLFGGTLDIEKFALPQTQAAYLKLSQLSFSEILAFAQYHQLNLVGHANATLPFWLSGEPCYICNGTLSQTSPSDLTLSPELLRAIQQAGYTERILSYLVNQSRINRLTANINVAKSGDMHLRAQLDTQLAENQATKVHFNYNHQENLFKLWQTLNFASEFEQNIEHQLYQQLERP